jgi:phosphoglycolate phosphatase
VPIVTVNQHRFDVDAVVFDKDGTLLDLDASWGPMALSWVHGVAPGDDPVISVLAGSLGLDLVSGRLRPDSVFAMSTLARIEADTRLLLASSGWSLDRIEHALARGGRAFDDTVRAMPMIPLVDVAVLMHELRAAGLGVAVFTSDEPDPTTMFLDHFGLHDLVGVVITAADVSEAKPSPEGLVTIATALGTTTERLLMVGDSVADREAAHAAGSPFVAVGHASRAASGAHTTVATVAELRAWLVSGGWRPGGVRRG